MPSDTWSNETCQRVLKQVFDLWVGPEIARRCASNPAVTIPPVVAVQIVFSSDGHPPVVRLNDEVKSVALIRLRAEVRASKKTGDPVYTNEVEQIEKVTLTPDDDLDCGHITVWDIGSYWHISFDARYNRRTATGYIERAKEFLEAAQGSLQKRCTSAAIDTLFSAAELAAKATLLAFPDPEFKRHTNHKAIKTKYGLGAKMGNVPQDFSDTLKKLESQRAAARYLNGNVSIDQSMAEQLAVQVQNMIDFAIDRYV